MVAILQGIEGLVVDLRCRHDPQHESRLSFPVARVDEVDHFQGAEIASSEISGTGARRRWIRKVEAECRNPDVTCGFILDGSRFVVEECDQL